MAQDDHFARGWEQAKNAREFHIATNAVWSVVSHDGHSIFSYEKVNSGAGVTFLKGVRYAISHGVDCKLIDHRGQACSSK